MYNYQHHLTFLLFLFLTPTLWGQFAPPQYVNRDTLAYEDTPWYVLDMDGDGYRDILFSANHETSQTGGTYYLKNNGTGSFGHPIPVLDGGPVVPGDLNGDGAPDLVLFGPSGCDCIVWRPNLGGGIMGAELPVSPINPNFVTDIQKIVDWDGDGDQDVVMVDRWVENSGQGVFNDFHLFSGAATYFGYAIGDLNGDGRQDVLRAPFQMPDSTPLQWIQQLPDGSFSDKLDIGFLPNQVDQLFLTDLDADNDQDILIFNSIPNGQVCSWYANDGLGHFSPNMALPTPGDWVVYYSFKPEPADLNGDNLPEILFTIIDTVQQVRSLAWFKNLGAGQFELFTGPATDARMLLADLSGDGKKDIVENNGAFLVREFDGNDSFLEAKSLYPHDADVSASMILDVDNDSDLDLCFISKLTRNLGWRANNGAGHFGEPQIVDRLPDADFSFLITDLERPDLNGDSLTDLCVYTGERTYVWLGTGNGQFAPPAIYPMSFINPRYLALSDADGDGDLDAVFAFSNSFGVANLLPPDTITWYANDGTGAFGSVITDITPAYDEVSTCNGDLDGNGENDLLFHILDDYGFSGFSGSFYWCPNLGDGNYGPKQLIYQYEHFALYLPQPCARDMDSDGDLDVITAFGWFENSEQAQSWKPRDIKNTGLVSSYQLSEDFDNDSDTDIFFVLNTGFSAASHNEVSLFKNDGEGRFSEEPDWHDESVRPDYIDAYAADLDNDKDLDVVFFGKNTIGWWENVSGLAPISAKCFLDNNRDGQQDSTETPLPGAALRLDPGGIVSFANAYGIARFYMDTGEYKITYLPADCRVLSTDSAEYTVHTPYPGPIRLFGFEPDSSQVSISSYLAATAPTRCGFEVPFQVSLRNTGCIAQRASFSLQLGPLVGFSSASPWPDFMQGDSLVWHTTDSLLPGEVRPIQLFLQMPGPDHLGETMQLKGYSWPASMPDKVEISEFKSVVNCAYDPNDKLVNYAFVPPNYDPKAWELAYTIRFQNTGTDTAFNITVRDPLDDLLDWTSFRPIAASHAMRPILRLTEGEAIFQFDNIQLLDSNVNEASSHGFVQFAVRLKAGLPAGTIVRNQAEIYFDLNPAILTNQSETRIEALSVGFLPKGGYSMASYPNPNTGAFTVEMPQPAEQGTLFRITDLAGRLVQEQKTEPGSAKQTIQANALPNGLYLLQVVAEGKVLAVEKFVKQ